jgi:hypothetical protein
MFGVGRCGGIEKTSLASLTSEVRRTRPHMPVTIAPRGLWPKRLAVAPVVILAENRLENTPKSQSATGAAMFFTFPEDARWKAERRP